MRRLFRILTVLFLTASVSVSCAADKSGVSQNPPADGETISETAAPEAVPAPPETQTAAPGIDVSRLTAHSWVMAGPSSAGALIFGDGTASFYLLENGEDKSVSGPVSFTEKTLSVGGHEFKWAVVASFCRLTEGDNSYSFTKAADADSAAGPYMLLSNTWSGDGMTLSFDGNMASLTVDGGPGFRGTYDLTDGKTLTVQDDSQGGALDNLAKGAKVTASSQETEDFPGPLAADGDLGTRWSSEYTDPSWLLLDLGSVKTVGAAVVYFETACSESFTFEVSTDGVNFREAASVRNNSASGIESPVTVLFGEPAECRYVRFNGLSRATQWGHSIYELELYRGIVGTAQCSLEYADGGIRLKLDGKTYSLSKSN